MNNFCVGILIAVLISFTVGLVLTYPLQAIAIALILMFIQKL